MKIKTFSFKNLFLLLITMISLSSCIHSNRETKENKESIKIGVILPMTGKLSFMGEQEKNGMLIAMNNINKQGEGRINLIFEDSKSNAKDGVSAAQKLITYDKVDLIITSTTGVSLAVKPIAEVNKVDLIAFCMEPDIAKNSPFLTRLYEGVNEEAMAFVDFINKSDSIKRIGILYNKVEAWEKVVNTMLLPSIKEKGVSVVFNEQYPVGEMNLKNIVAKLKEAKTDHLILLSYGFEFPTLFPLLIENGVHPKTKILGGWGFLYPNINSELLEGVHVSGPEYVFKKDTLALNFMTEYSRAFSTRANYDAAMAYNVIELVHTYFDKEQNKLRKRFKEMIKNQNIPSSVVGPYYIDSDGSMIIKTSMGKYRNGSIVLEVNE